MSNLLPPLFRAFMRSFAAGVLCAAALPANAAPSALLPGNSVSFSGNGKLGAFSDVASFTLGAAAGITDLTSWTNMTTSGISGFSVTISDGTNPSFASATQTSFSGNLLQSKLEIPSLAAGTYTLTFSGFGTGTSGGLYSSTLNVVMPSAVPEPGAWLMLLAGTCLVFTIARRRFGSRSAVPAATPGFGLTARS